MGITVAVKMDHLALPKSTVSVPRDVSKIILVPNVEYRGTVKATVKDFIRRNFFIPDELQVLQAPLFRKLSEKENIEDLYKRYACQTEVETPDIHVEEDSYTFFCREGGRTIDLEDTRSLEDYHILDKMVLQLRKLPQPLPGEGGRIFVETKDGILPLLDINITTKVSEIKNALESMTGIPVEHQILSSVGRIMHDEFLIKDFSGLHRVCEDSTLDLCKSGDSNLDQAHRRMVVSVDVMGEQKFAMIVQGRDEVQSVLQVVEARTSIAMWQQRITFSGRILQENKPLSDYHIHPECTLQVTIFKSPCKASTKVVHTLHNMENSGQEPRPAARKIRLLRTIRGRSNGTITIPVLTTDTVSDLKRKVRRTLQPLTERNFMVIHALGADSGDSPKRASLSPGQASNNDSGKKMLRELSFNVKNFPGSLVNASPSTLSERTQTPPICQISRSPARSGDGSSSKKVTRILSFERPSARQVNPRNHELSEVALQSSAAPLFPPPLGPRRVFPTEESILGVTVPTTVVSGKLPEVKLTPPKLGNVDDSASSNGPKLNSAPERLEVTSTLPRTHTRAWSMGSGCVACNEFLPLPDELSRPQSSVEHIQTHVPTSLASDTSTLAGSTSSQLPSVPIGCMHHQTAVVVEKKGLGAWLTDSIQNLKDHIRVPFTDR